MTTIRKAEPKDAREIHEAHMTSIQELCKKDYTPEQLLAWGGRKYDEKKMLNGIATHSVWVIEHEGQVEGFCHVIVDKDEDGAYANLASLYLTPKVVGHGLGRALMEVAESHLRLINIRRVKLNSTITSENFYLKMGYQKTADCTEYTVRGVGIPCIPMIKTL